MFDPPTVASMGEQLKVIKVNPESDAAYLEGVRKVLSGFVGTVLEEDTRVPVNHLWHIVGAVSAKDA